jgi:hypothetical protein
MNAAFFIWIGIMVSVLSLGFYYMGQRLIMPFNLASPLKQIAWTVLSSDVSLSRSVPSSWSDSPKNTADSIRGSGTSRSDSCRSSS